VSATDEIDFPKRAEALERWCGIGGPLGLDGCFDTARGFAGPNGCWRQERRQLHRRVFSTLGRRLPSGVGRGVAVLLGGLPGAGKTTLRTRLLRERKLSEHVPVDIDDIREVLIGLLHDAVVLPVVLGDWVAGGGPLTPFELSSSCHREAKHLESVHVSGVVTDRCPNLVIDTTLSTTEAGSRWIAELRDADCQEVRGILLEAPPDEAMDRCMNRWRRGVSDYFDGVGLGGRFIPSSNFAAYLPEDLAQPTCIEAYERLRDAGAPEGFDSTMRYRTVVRYGVCRFEQVE